MRLLSIVLLCLCAVPVSAARLAIIVDDIGYRHTDEDVLMLPANVTFSVLPHTPWGKRIAKAAHHQGHEIMLHLPMQALNGKALGPGGLHNKMSKDEFKQTLTQAIDSVPYAQGCNNHMGSFLTQLQQPMAWLMSTLQHRRLYFVDSMTTRYSKAGHQAREHDVPTLQRQVFLDNQLSLAALEKQLQQAITLAQEEGQAILIAHPYPETLAFLQQQLPQLPASHIQLVKVSRLLPYKKGFPNGSPHEASNAQPD
ncbi:divergent polysaccharide deacetylase family protein [Shewanella sp. YIC-542]|uniref:divergent polysaccharide deacetylase family protein n=1 Tax=Shewanella mytili TaxID=3377111 RepID=UPI00398F8413